MQLVIKIVIIVYSTNTVTLDFVYYLFTIVFLLFLFFFENTFTLQTIHRKTNKKDIYARVLLSFLVGKIEFSRKFACSA